MRRRDVNRLHEEIEDLFSDLWHVPRFAGLRRGFRPPVDCFRTAEPPELRIVVELAGVDPADVQIIAFERELVVAGERRRPREQQRLSYYQMELEYGGFQRRIALPADVDTSGGRADYERGLLTIVLPVAPAQPAKPERVSIPVKSGV